MKGGRAQIGLLFVCAALVLSGLTLLFWDFVRETVVLPLYYLFWVAGLFLKSLSQSVYWALLLAACLLLAVNALGKLPRESPSPQAVTSLQAEPSRYRFWFELCEAKSTPSSRMQFAVELRRLVLALLAYQEGWDTSQVERQAAANGLDLPAPVKDLLQKRELPAAAETTRPPFWERVMRRGRPRSGSEGEPLTDEHVQEILHFIESRLELTQNGP